MNLGVILNMNYRIQHLMKVMGIVTIFILSVKLYLYGIPKEIYGITEIGFTAIGISVICVGLYEKWGWRLNPLLDIPRFQSKYNGKVCYNYDNKKGEKEVEITVQQTFLFVNVSLKSDEIISNTVTSNLIKENNVYVLYYTYITNPSSNAIEKNPIQRGLARLMIDTKKNCFFIPRVRTMSGQYWTNRLTIGDLKFDVLG